MSAKNGKEQKQVRLVIGDRSYDVTAFKKKHPGGSVIGFYDNMDATDVFEAFHCHSESAQKWLKSLPSRPIQKQDHVDDSPLIKDYRKLVEELHEEGFYEPYWRAQIPRLLEVILLQILSLWLVVNYSWVLGGFVYGVVVGRNGLLMHDMGHRAFFGNLKKDKLIHQIFFGLGITGSGTFWNNQHNKHHAATQELQHDTDLATLPVVAFHREVARDGSPSYLRWQWIVFLPAQLLLFFYWKFTHFRHAVRVRNLTEVSAIIAHHVITMYICVAGGAGLMGWLVYQSIGYAWGGFYLATVFSMNHTHRPVVPAHHKRDWVHRSCEYTTNVNPTPFTEWLTGYLCYQTEHHMFPSIPHPRLPEVAPKVRALLKKHNVVYDSKSMSDAFKMVIVNLYDVGQDAHSGELEGKSFFHER